MTERDFEIIDAVVNLNDEIINVVLTYLGYGFLAGFAFLFLPMGVRLALGIIKPR